MAVQWFGEAHEEHWARANFMFGEMAVQEALVGDPVFSHTRYCSPCHLLDCW